MTIETLSLRITESEIFSVNEKGLCKVVLKEDKFFTVFQNAFLAISIEIKLYLIWNICSQLLCYIITPEAVFELFFCLFF